MGIVRLSLFLLLLDDAWSIRNVHDVHLVVEPPAVVRGGTAALICERDLQGKPLYAVKWYRGTHEFYSYSPSEDPKTRNFEVPGIFVDLHHSDGQQVTLHRMDLSLAGNFSCEVTADSPYFSTSIAYKYIDIIALPERAPVLTTEQQHYQPGDVLRANCTSSASRPAANLIISINNEPLISSETLLYPTENGFQWTAAHAEALLTQSMFPGGRLRLRCHARVHHLYSDVATLDLFTPDVDPRPEKITLPNGSSGAPALPPSWLLLLLVVALVSTTRSVFDQEKYFEGQAYSYSYVDTKECALRSLGVSLYPKS